ncbi:MAG: hypothetical protein HY925_08860 [Elusimicrobia bacterium]|nr:hypothetical protein [Elusimicrobiota bacterium]
MTRGVFASLAAVLLVPTCALAQRVLAPVVEGPAPVSGVAAVPLAGSLALAPSPLSISPSLAPPKVTSSGLLLGAARPLVNPARVPFAGLEGALRGL